MLLARRSIELKHKHSISFHIQIEMRDFQLCDEFKSVIFELKVYGIYFAGSGLPQKNKQNIKQDL